MMRTFAASLLTAVMLLGGWALAAEVEGTRSFSLQPRVLEFAPSRDDFTIDTVLFTIYAQGGKATLNGHKFTRSRELDLLRAGKNRFKLPALTIGYTGEAAYLSLKVTFKQIPPASDYAYYEVPTDRYALLSYATAWDEPDEFARARFDYHRVETLQQFEQALSKPIVVKLNDEPLPVDPEEQKKK